MRDVSRESDPSLTKQPDNSSNGARGNERATRCLNALPESPAMTQKICKEGIDSSAIDVIISTTELVFSAQELAAAEGSETQERSLAGMGF